MLRMSYYNKVLCIVRFQGCKCTLQVPPEKNSGCIGILNFKVFPLFFNRFLNDPNKSVDLRRWGTEGLAYLTLDAEVKEELINDSGALRSLIDVVAVSFLDLFDLKLITY